MKSHFIYFKEKNVDPIDNTQHAMTVDETDNNGYTPLMHAAKNGIINKFHFHGSN